MIECRGEQLHREFEEYFGKFNKRGKMMAQNKFAINKRYLMPDCTSTERRNLRTVEEKRSDFLRVARKRTDIFMLWPLFITQNY